ncbi:hypothetical protein D1007_27438 [Hordeum vulgare]|nr:hypothetical protein D1007_27438 [Hordeum vulgare]
MAGRGGPFPRSSSAQGAVSGSLGKSQGLGKAHGQGFRNPAQAIAKSAAPPATAGVKTTAPPVVAGGKAGDDAHRLQPRGRWGDDGVNAYGDGQHRGSSSFGGGRGYAWQANAGNGQGFSGHPGKFVLGPSGPKRGGYRQRWAGRGGGRIPRPPAQLESVNEANGEHRQVQPKAPSISLPPTKGTADAVVVVDRAPRPIGNRSY